MDNLPQMRLDLAGGKFPDGSVFHEKAVLEQIVDVGSKRVFDIPALLKITADGLFLGNPAFLDNERFQKTAVSRWDVRKEHG